MASGNQPSHSASSSTAAKSQDPLTFDYYFQTVDSARSSTRDSYNFPIDSPDILLHTSATSSFTSSTQSFPSSAAYTESELGYTPIDQELSSKYARSTRKAHFGERAEFVEPTTGQTSSKPSAPAPRDKDNSPNAQYHSLPKLPSVSAPGMVLPPPIPIVVQAPPPPPRKFGFRPLPRSRTPSTSSTSSTHSAHFVPAGAQLPDVWSPTCEQGATAPRLEHAGSGRVRPGVSSTTEPEDNVSSLNSVLIPAAALDLGTPFSLQGTADFDIATGGMTSDAGAAAPDGRATDALINSTIETTAVAAAGDDQDGPRVVEGERPLMHTQREAKHPPQLFIPTVKAVVEQPLSTPLASHIPPHPLVAPPPPPTDPSSAPQEQQGSEEVIMETTLHPTDAMVSGPLDQETENAASNAAEPHASARSSTATVAATAARTSISSMTGLAPASASRIESPIVSHSFAQESHTEGAPVSLTEAEGIMQAHDGQESDDYVPLQPLAAVQANGTAADDDNVPLSQLHPGARVHESEPRQLENEANRTTPQPTAQQPETTAFSNHDLLRDFDATLALLEVEGDPEPLPEYMLRADVSRGEATLARGPRRAFRPAPPPTWPPPLPLDPTQPAPPPYMRIEGESERRKHTARLKAFFTRSRPASIATSAPNGPYGQAEPPSSTSSNFSTASGGGFLRRLHSRRGGGSNTSLPSASSDGGAAPPSGASVSAETAARSDPAVAASDSGFAGLPSDEPVAGRPLLRDGQLLVYPEGVVCEACRNTGYAGHDHDHGALQPCAVCWKRFARPFGARLARFFRKDVLDSEQGARIRRRLQRPLSAPPGMTFGLESGGTTAAENQADHTDETIGQVPRVEISVPT